MVLPAFSFVFFLRPLSACILGWGCPPQNRFFRLLSSLFFSSFRGGVLCDLRPSPPSFLILALWTLPKGDFMFFLRLSGFFFQLAKDSDKME